MADVNKLLPFILRWEGGFVNDPIDKGGATNKGVTIATWRQIGYDKDGDGDIDVDDLRQLTIHDVRDRVLKPHYWDRWRADEIQNQSIANILVDWVWASGKWGIIIPQRLLGVKADGQIGAITLAALHKEEPARFFSRVMEARRMFIAGIVARDPSQRRFQQGWLNRLNDIKFER